MLSHPPRLSARNGAFLLELLGLFVVTLKRWLLVIALAVLALALALALGHSGPISTSYLP